MGDSSIGPQILKPKWYPCYWKLRTQDLMVLVSGLSGRQLVLNASVMYGSKFRRL